MESKNVRYKGSNRGAQGDRSAIPAAPFHHSHLASAYALRGEPERAAAELAEARASPC
jgi:hypothetical protein